jgi:hypothetical protein
MPTTNGSGIRVRRLEPDAGKLARPVLRGLGEQQRFPGYPVILSGRPSGFAFLHWEFFQATFRRDRTYRLSAGSGLVYALCRAA